MSPAATSNSGERARRRVRAYVLAAVSTLTIGLQRGARADDLVTIWVDPGVNVDVYWNINLSGTVYIAADIDGRPACLDYWWIVWPFTQIVQLGKHCGHAKFELPGLSNFALGGKLRAGGAEARTRLRGTSNEKVAHNFPEIAF